METNEEIASTSNGTEESGRGCRNKKKQVDPTICPVCCVTLRSTEVNQHLSCEIDKLYKISAKSKQINGKCSNSSLSDINGTENGADKCWETYQKVRSNRQGRQKLKSRKRKCEEVVCPVCNKETSEDITIHIDKCLRAGEESDENIDVEGYEEYEWAGQSRVRATSLLQGGVSCLGTTIGTTEEDEDLVVDGDDSQIYGVPQYSEKDIIQPGSDRENEALRKAVIGDDDERTKCSDESCREENLTGDDPVLTALKNRIRELEGADGCKDDGYKCLICMERYKTPVISVCCWHVHCEICWLQTLGAKKLCPQCNMITSPADLRRIYM